MVQNIVGRSRRQEPDRFPSCELHGTKVVFSFPPSCPLATADPQRSLQGMLDEATSFHITDLANMQTRQTLFAVHRICSHCSLGSHGDWLRQRFAAPEASRC